MLKLFSTDQDVSTGKKSLINEYYDEIIFYEPSQFFHQILTNPRPLGSLNAIRHETDCKRFVFLLFLIILINLIILNHIILVKEKETETLTKLESARNRIRNEIRDMKDRLKLTQEKLQSLKEKVETEDLVVEDTI